MIMSSKGEGRKNALAMVTKVRKEDRARGGGGKKVRCSQSGCVGKNDRVVTKVKRTKNYKTIDGRFNALT